jgi:hypothetical protein
LTSFDKKEGISGSVWVMAQGKGCWEQKEESIEDFAKRVEWAVILKIRVSKNDPTKPIPID